MQMQIQEYKDKKQYSVVLGQRQCMLADSCALWQMGKAKAQRKDGWVSEREIGGKTREQTMSSSLVLPRARPRLSGRK